MSKFKHTPGPWEICSLSGDIIVTEQNTIMVTNKGIRGRGDSDIDIANARLIAAAPEMLEALINEVKFNIEDFGLDQIEDNMEFKAMVEAIEKATGLTIQEKIS